MARKSKLILSIILSFFIHLSIFGPVLLKKELKKIKYKSSSIDTKFKNSYPSEIEINLENSLKFTYYQQKPTTKTLSEDNFLKTGQLKDKVLKLIYKKISKLWNSSIPPEQGNVKVRLFLNKLGEIVDIEILSGSSPDSLKKFIISLIKKASPFKEIKNYAKDEDIVVDCVFLIR